MIYWIICIAIFAAAIVISYYVVPLEHRLNHARSLKGAAYWLALSLWSSLWVTAAVQAFAGPRVVFPLWIRIVGAAYMVAGYALQIWAWRVNYFLIPAIIYIPPDLRVITGPYRFCPHPFYMGCIFAGIGIVWLLGQWWALYPLCAYVALILRRIIIENRVLSQSPSI